jgi:hypothetical protein
MTLNNLFTYLESPPIEMNPILLSDEKVSKYGNICRNILQKSKNNIPYDSNNNDSQARLLSSIPENKLLNIGSKFKLGDSVLWASHRHMRIPPLLDENQKYCINLEKILTEHFQISNKINLLFIKNCRNLRSLENIPETVKNNFKCDHIYEFFRRFINDFDNLNIHRLNTDDELLLKKFKLNFKKYCNLYNKLHLQNLSNTNQILYTFFSQFVNAESEFSLQLTDFIKAHIPTKNIYKFFIQDTKDKFKKLHILQVIYIFMCTKS